MRRGRGGKSSVKRVRGTSKAAEGDNTEPAKKYPVSAEYSFAAGYERDLELLSQVVRAQESGHGSAPAQLIDKMKANPAQQWQTGDECYQTVWGVEDDAHLFNEAIGALKKDVGALRKLYSGLPQSSKQPPADLLAHIKENVAKKGSSTAFWEQHDPDYELYTDSEEEADGRIARFPPPVRALRKIQRQAVKRRVQRALVARALEATEKDVAIGELTNYVKEKIIKELQISPEKERKKAQRAEWRAWQRAGDYVRLNLDLPQDVPSIVASSGKSVPPTLAPKNSIIHLVETEFAKRFPSHLRSKHIEHFAANPARQINPFQYIIEDSAVFRNGEKHKIKVGLYDVRDETATQDLYFANVSQMLGKPLSTAYQQVNVYKDIQFLFANLKRWVPLNALKDDSMLRPHTRLLRSAIARKVIQERIQDAARKDDADGDISMVQVTAATSLEKADSDEEKDEAAERKKEEELVRRLIREGPQEYPAAMAGYGPDHVAVRLGGEHGHMRNAFDTYRARSNVLEALAGSKCTAPVSMLYESSEDENMTYIDPQQKYRQRYRLYSKWERKSPKATQSATVEEIRPDDVGLMSSSSDEGTTKRKRKSKDKQSPTKRPKAHRVAIQQIWRESIGEKEEAWRSLSVKPRVRMIEPRFDRGPSRPKMPVGIMAQGIDHLGTDKQLFGIDEAEFHRRFALNKLWQTQMPGKDVKLATRRYFAVIINDRKQQIRVVNAHPTKLVFTKSPQQAMVDFQWELYWRSARLGLVDARQAAKALRYHQLKANNYVVAKDELEKSVKLRERVNELQTHATPRHMKMRVLTQMTQEDMNSFLHPDEEDMAAVKKEKGVTQQEMKLVAFESGRIDPFEANEHELKGEFKRIHDHIVASEDLQATPDLAFMKRVATRTRTLLPQLCFGRNRRYKNVYQEYRRAVNERVSYEAAWLSNKAKRSTTATTAATAADEDDTTQPPLKAEA